MKVCLHNSYRYQDGRISPMDVLSLDELKGSVSENTLGAEPFLQFQNVYIFPGFVDVHVHFREPGLTHKADMATESLAAVAGGVTTAMDMPNTSPATTSAEALKGKMELAREKSVAKLSFHIGATNDNVEEICRLIKEGDDKTGITPDVYVR